VTSDTCPKISEAGTSLGIASIGCHHAHRRSNLDLTTFNLAAKTSHQRARTVEESRTTGQIKIEPNYRLFVSSDHRSEGRVKMIRTYPTAASRRTERKKRILAANCDESPRPPSATLTVSWPISTKLDRSVDVTNRSCFRRVRQFGSQIPRKMVTLLAERRPSVVRTHERPSAASPRLARPCAPLARRSSDLTNPHDDQANRL
jgi:hypothetical protein